MSGDQLTLGAVPARLEKREREIAAQAEAAKERIAELSAQPCVAATCPLTLDEAADRALLLTL